MISIMMPVYNTAPYLKMAIESILNQTYKNFELIIVNDGSTDNSEQVIRSFSDNRIKYIKQENKGVAEARNTALRYMKGEYLTFLDSDDIALPNRLETMERHFKWKQVGIVHHDLIVFNDKEPTKYIQGFHLERTRYLRYFLKIGIPISAGTATMFRRDVIKGYTFDKTLDIGEDSDFIFRTMEKWDTIHIPEPLLLYRRHNSNATNSDNAELHAAHVRKLIDRHNLSELVPELDWSMGPTHEVIARAAAIIALFYARRYLLGDAGEWMKQAEYYANTHDARCFVNGITHLIERKLDLAYNSLVTCKIHDHIVKNYLGDICALQGKNDAAARYFFESIRIQENYIEALDNIKALSVAKGIFYTDSSLFKYNS